MSPTMEELRQAQKQPHDFRPRFERTGCSLCGLDRAHPMHGATPPAPIDCACGESVERGDLAEHLRVEHGVIARGFDPWRVTEKQYLHLVGMLGLFHRREGRGS